jgi:hypothetical protein
MELIISEVQKRNILWNKLNKNYRDRLVSGKNLYPTHFKTHCMSKKKKKQKIPDYGHPQIHVRR